VERARVQEGIDEGMTKEGERDEEEEEGTYQDNQ
jgi:hypothetical protein